MEREKWLEISLPLETNFFPFLFLPRNHRRSTRAQDAGKGNMSVLRVPVVVAETKIIKELRTIEEQYLLTSRAISGPRLFPVRRLPFFLFSFSVYLPVYASSSDPFPRREPPFPYVNPIYRLDFSRRKLVNGEPMYF